MFESMDGWWKVWFFLRNDADAPLPMFTSSCLILQPNWGYGVASKDLHMLQSLCEVVEQLRQEGLTGVNLPRTFFNC
jgi:hypothetical protein